MHKIGQVQYIWGKTGEIVKTGANEGKEEAEKRGISTVFNMQVRSYICHIFL